MIKVFFIERHEKNECDSSEASHPLWSYMVKHDFKPASVWHAGTWLCDSVSCAPVAGNHKLHQFVS